MTWLFPPSKCQCGLQQQQFHPKQNLFLNHGWKFCWNPNPKIADERGRETEREGKRARERSEGEARGGEYGQSTGEKLRNLWRRIVQSRSCVYSCRNWGIGELRRVGVESWASLVGAPWRPVFVMAGDVVLWLICFLAVALLLGILVYQVYIPLLLFDSFSNICIICVLSLLPWLLLSGSFFSFDYFFEAEVEFP